MMIEELKKNKNFHGSGLQSGYIEKCNKKLNSETYKVQDLQMFAEAKIYKESVINLKRCH